MGDNTEVEAFGSESLENDVEVEHFDKEPLDDELLEAVSRSDNTLDTVTESAETHSSTDPEDDASQHRKFLEGIDTKNWGECIEFECPTDSVCIKVDKLLSQPVQALPEPVALLPDQDSKFKELQSKFRDCEDALSRFGILFEQAVQRIDGQLQHMVNWQRNSMRVQDDQRRKIDALIAEVGVDEVKARIQHMEREARVQQLGRGAAGFGGARNRDLQFPMEVSQPSDFAPRHPMNENSYNRRGRGNRRGGARY